MIFSLNIFEKIQYKVAQIPWKSSEHMKIYQKTPRNRTGAVRQIQKTK
jgi:hypothetical protein